MFNLLTYINYVYVCPILPDIDAVEYFSGTAAIVGSFVANGRKALEFDYIHNPPFPILDVRARIPDRCALRNDARPWRACSFRHGVQYLGISLPEHDGKIKALSMRHPRRAGHVHFQYQRRQHASGADGTLGDAPAHPSSFLVA